MLMLKEQVLKNDGELLTVFSWRQLLVWPSHLIFYGISPDICDL